MRLLDTLLTSIACIGFKIFPYNFFHNFIKKNIIMKIIKKNQLGSIKMLIKFMLVKLLLFMSKYVDRYEIKAITT